VTTFQRARSDEQREQRRRAILDTAAAMVLDMPVGDLTLNELSRRVGLAKSNVLRYFETREAVLLELYDAAWAAWLDRLEPELTASTDAGPASAPATWIPAGRSPDPRIDAVAAVVAASLAGDRLVCELMSSSASVLERNVSTAIARRSKLAAIANTERLGRILRTALPGLADGGTFPVAAGTLIAVTGIWPLANPTDTMLCVYDDPDMATLRVDFESALREMLATLYAGCLLRWPADA